MIHSDGRVEEFQMGGFHCPCLFTALNKCFGLAWVIDRVWNFMQMILKEILICVTECFLSESYSEIFLKYWEWEMTYQDT